MGFLILHHLVLCSILSLLFLLEAQNANISLGSSLVASEDASWKSPSGDFAFGFSRINNQDLFLLAIWYDKIPERTLVWYANGDDPAPKGSKLQLSNNGNFTLTGPQGQEIWNPKSSTDGVAYAAMLDDGNFVLAGRDSNYLWESFKNPTDTILPTQVLELGGKLSSRQTETNYSKGRFQLFMKTDGNLVLRPIGLPTDFPYPAYYKSNTDGADEMNSGYRMVFNESGDLNVFVRNGSVVNLTKSRTKSTGDYFYRATLEADGIFALYAHPRTQADGIFALYAHPRTQTNGSWGQTWYAIWSVPNDICSDMDTGIATDLGGGPCGYNSYCKLDEKRRPFCECLPGFSLSDPNNKLNGCKQNRIPNCQQDNTKPEDLYVMQELPNAYWPVSANYEQLQGLNEDDCRRLCLSDCNCMVAVIKEGTCWNKKLPLSKGRLDYNTYGKALIKVSKSDASSDEPSVGNSNVEKKDRTTLILVGAVFLGSSVFLNFLLVAAITLFVFYSYKNRLNRTKTSNILETNQRTFTYRDLEEATDGFKEELGRGAFGTVYKGVLISSSSKTYVAVKKLDRMVQEGEKEFKTEVSAIAKTHHKNLVRLVGFCDEGSNKLLVYEFMSNGTLASFLFGISRPDWNKRLQMAFGIARGLTYLHEECSTQIIHCDIKPQNILLDDSFTARISDFGLAKLLMSDQTRTHTAIRGTRGYVAPEWFRNMPITAKVDVYSYGVMLLEIICCRRGLEMESENEEEVILADWAYDCYKVKRLDKLVENDEEARNDIKRVEKLVMVAIWCIQEDPSLRPSVRTVTQMLEGVVQVSVPPCPSPFSSIC
ncbi:G-type lectin S-receptor-like serine/threonine-protein kinase LECRK3 [Hevea brasiliensis]|uniref:G-type lectin S-receptor-like serine/threonine-protein kinase LECRK3 n=1 Tax=Hevea brasiliensis TaxID=3981 RepID=UPI0025E3F768|nr:G-type lectin S-receptor-like serine/threonine-protein kinase LECRK3 [Hevea brasiliensis]